MSSNYFALVSEEHRKCKNQLDIMRTSFEIGELVKWLGDFKG